VCGGYPTPTGERYGHGAVPLPGNFFGSKWTIFVPIFCVPLNTPLLTWFVSSGHAWTVGHGVPNLFLVTPWTCCTHKIHSRFPYNRLHSCPTTTE